MMAYSLLTPMCVIPTHICVIKIKLLNIHQQIRIMERTCLVMTFSFRLMLHRSNIPSCVINNGWGGISPLIDVINRMGLSQRYIKALPEWPVLLIIWCANLISYSDLAASSCFLWQQTTVPYNGNQYPCKSYTMFLSPNIFFTAVQYHGSFLANCHWRYITFRNEFNFSREFRNDLF